MNNSINKDNLDWLHQTNPHLVDAACSIIGKGVTITPSRKGLPTLAVDDLQMHSSYDPAAESAKLAQLAVESIPEGNIVILLGLGLGYLAEALLKLKNCRLAIIETDPQIVAAANQFGCLSRLGDSWIILESKAEKAVESLRGFVETSGGWSKASIVTHAPSVKRFPGFYSGVEALIRAQGTCLTDKLSILVVTPIYGGSLPIAHYCANSFKRLGHHVETLDNSIYDEARRQIETVSRDKRHRGMLGDLLATLMSETITAKALDSAVDLVWLLAQSPMSAQVASELKKHRIPSAYWFVEEWQLREYWKDYATRFDYFFTIQDAGIHQALARIGVSRMKKLDLAADPEIHKPLELTPEELTEFGSDVSHVGAGFRNRRQVFSSLTGYNFKLWGDNWDDPGLLRRHLQRNGARISTNDSVKIFNAAKINLNLHSSQFHNGVNPDGDYLNPRTFEIASCGGFQLVDTRRDLPDFFERDKEIAVFDDEREIAPKIEYYLKNEGERQTIAEAGRRKTLAEHTYELRMSEALNFIFAHEDGRASTRHPNHIENLIREAGDDAELVSFLKEIKAEGVVSLDQIVERIRKREGDLGKPELIFLLMFEFRRWMAEKDLV